MIKDIDILIKLDENGFFEITTDTIKGRVEAIIISRLETTSPIKLDIVFDENDEIIVFSAAGLKSIGYFPVRTPTMPNDEEIYNFQVAKYVLNNALYIRAEGVPDSEIALTIRIEADTDEQLYNYLN